MAIQALIADDEVLARRKLRYLLDGEPDVQVIGEGSNASEVIDLVGATTPQLLFLDVKMPGMNGLEVVEHLSRNSDRPVPHVIFTTAYDQYALQAFEIRAIDYLLKPFTAERLQMAVQRVREQIEFTSLSAVRSQKNQKEKSDYTTRLVFKSRGRILFLSVTDVRWIGAEENYVRICTANETHLLRETMASMEQKLDPQSFLRVHRSAMVNLKYVREVRTEPQGEFVVQLIDGQKVPMSRSYHSRIRELLAKA
ncbi:MAG TPA: LytTR family DNA-binding domain-containing protein [Terracidiphilus sp.]|jgi:two-component system LytT family response regulator|nr:LytTR family DNA-binding domain-containing protein [Terracidiphilus sp.]